MRRNLNYIVSLCIDSYFYWVSFYLFYSCWWFTFCFTPVSSQSKWPSTKSLNHFYKRLFSSMVIEMRLEMLRRFSYTLQRSLTMEKVIFPNPGSGPELDNIFRCSSTKRWLTFYFMVDDRVGREENVDVAVVYIGEDHSFKLVVKNSCMIWIPVIICNIKHFSLSLLINLCISCNVYPQK